MNNINAFGESRLRELGTVSPSSQGPPYHAIILQISLQIALQVDLHNETG